MLDGGELLFRKRNVSSMNIEVSAVCAEDSIDSDDLQTANTPARRSRRHFASVATSDNMAFVNQMFLSKRTHISHEVGTGSTAHSSKRDHCNSSSGKSC